MQKRKLLIATIIGGFLLLTPTKPTLAAQENTSPIDAVIKTKQVIKRAVALYGGRQFLNAINSVNVEIGGIMRTLETHIRPSGLGGDFPATRRYRFQLKEENYASRSHWNDQDTVGCLTGCTSFYEFLVRGDEKYLLFPDSEVSSQGFAPDLSGVQSIVPQLVAKALANNQTKIIWLGESNASGQMADVITFPERFNGMLNFHFSQESGLLVRMTRPATGNYGDTVSWTEFNDYTEQDGTFVPGTYRRLFVDFGVLEAEYLNFDLNAVLSEDMFRPPEDFVIFDNAPFGETRWVELAPHVFQIEFPNNAYVVEFDDYVILIDAPSGWVDEFEALIEENLGPKPIRYVVPTANYGQHALGLREFVAAGVPILATERDISAYRAMLAGRFELDPDMLALNPREAEFGVLDGKRVFDDGTTRLELVNIGPTSVADDLIVAYLPAHRLAITSELFNLNPKDIPRSIPAPYKNNALRNLAAFESAGFEVDKIYRIRNRRTMTLERFRELIESD